MGNVFCDTEGGPIRKSNLCRRSFQPLLKRAALPRIRFHDLRHTAATLLLAEGIHPRRGSTGCSEGSPSRQAHWLHAGYTGAKHRLGRAFSPDLLVAV